MGGMVLQSPWRPTAVLGALEALATPNTSELRIAVAYATRRGCDELIPRLIQGIGPQSWQAATKTAIVCTDFHMTEPRALEDLTAHGFAVHLAAIGSPNYHPKIYAFASAGSWTALVGSANLTRSALTVNVEACAIAQLDRGFGSDWNALLANSTALTKDVLENYKQRRRRQPPPISPDPTRRKRPPRRLAHNLVSFPDEVLARRLVPTRFECLWVQAGSMRSSESYSQLELPRYSHRFFRKRFGQYSNAHKLIGRLELFAHGTKWDDRRLTWHGNNKMERLNLPTQAKGGVAYSDTAILFTRSRGGRYQLSVAPWNSTVAVAWREASQKLGQEYQLGKNSPRRCGLF